MVHQAILFYPAKLATSQVLPEQHEAAFVCKLSSVRDSQPLGALAGSLTSLSTLLQRDALRRCFTELLLLHLHSTSFKIEGVSSQTSMEQTAAG